jgi:hypothetical protein
MRMAVLCGSTSTEWGAFSTDTRELAWNLIHDCPEALLGYDRLYLWDWQYNDLAVRTDNPRWDPDEVIHDRIAAEILAPLT